MQRSARAVVPLAGAQDPSGRRSARLSEVFNAFVRGSRTVKTINDANLFIESICSQDDRAGCIERLVASIKALDSLRFALRSDVSSKFLNESLKDLLLVLKDPVVKLPCSGDLLKQILTVLVQPPTLWTALITAYAADELCTEFQIGFAWLLLELLCWTDNPPIDVDDTARELTDRKSLLNSTNLEVRSFGSRILHVLEAKQSNLEASTFGPGGRHDNDQVDYRKIAIFPSNEELTCKEKPFYRRADALGQAAFDARVHAHLDNQFRLLREDFLAELREDIGTSGTSRQARRPKTKLRGLSLAGFYCGKMRSRSPFMLAVSVAKGLGPFTTLLPQDRKAYLRENPRFLKHQSFGCITDGESIVSFATLLRVDELLVQHDPIITLRTPNEVSLERLLMSLKMSKDLEFILMDTPVFAYEPILSCLQAKVELPLWRQLLASGLKEVKATDYESRISPARILEQLGTAANGDVQDILALRKPVQLDESQMQSLISGLRQSISLIQGPPGTGKSFIGALLAKALNEHTSQKILVLCYTNHALDQFLEDLLDVGIPAARMVRLGAQSSARTKPLLLSEQAANQRRAQQTWDIINSLNVTLDKHEIDLQALQDSFLGSRPSVKTILEYLEFSENDYDFFRALQMPELDSDEDVVGKGGKAIKVDYLFDRWSRGMDAGFMSNNVPEGLTYVWQLDQDARQSKLQAWKRELYADLSSHIARTARSFDKHESTVREALGQRDADIIQTKQIVACTTTAAAKYTKQIQTASPGIVLVEEAGEILESHVLTALSPNTQQVILIGDHQQLRPKVNNYALTVERGEGYDLNRSLFERLILAGLPHTTLHQQHRMCPEISSFVRELTYPDLVDAPSTRNREPVRGICKRVVFIDHSKPELAASQIAERRDQGASVSKQNTWEAAMVLKVVRYMAQQGYGTADQVVLTPYLGQLHLLRKELARENDPVLSDLDSFELLRAGLLAPSSAAQSKRPIKISTIDNYQGEESDVVIVSLTRSNAEGDIGFMASPERVNVLLSRARKAIVLIGNSQTFLSSRRGGETWDRLFNLLAEGNHILDGLPVKCEQHPDRQQVLKEPSDFDTLCPDGGCSEPCGVKLACQKHDCPQKCHKLTDHSKIKCQVVVSDQCPQGHKITWRCFSLRPSSCATCDAEARRVAERQQRDLMLEESRQAKQRVYAQQLAEIQQELDHHRRMIKEEQDSVQQETVLRQHRQDLENVKSQAQRMKESSNAQTNVIRKAAQATGRKPTSSKASTSPDSRKTPETGSVITGESTTQPLNTENNEHETDDATCLPESAARDDWEYEKAYEGAKDEALDELMGMIGLENVKEAFLEIKSRIDLAVRQNISLKKERFGAALLGNPGTGKTTVARLYAKFLTNVGALPGNCFVETTGSKLANEGVTGCKKILDDIQNKGGGTLFIDEAYQLTSGSSYGGAAVLDFLLAEVENLTGKVVFILAGYNKQMEAFFAHNPGIPSRFPRQMQFADYDDAELLGILNYGIAKQYGPGCMKLEGGDRGLYARIVSRRVGRGRGKAGFGNARAVENTLSSIASRQAKRLRKARRAGSDADDMLLTKEDLIGPEPDAVLAKNQTWKKLQGLTGLVSVKESVKALFDSIQFNYHREIAEEPLVDFTLNKVFLGSPGTGKTTVAKLYGRLLADTGLLSDGEVVVKTPADFVGNVLGASEANTKGILNSAIGKVLLIDEAYGLSAGQGDPYKTAVIDTIVGEVQSVPGDDRCVLMLGYKEQMEEMMQNANPGLARRFPIDSAFVFDDFSPDEIATIFDAKLMTIGFKATERARAVALEVLARARNRPHFGNAGEVDILLNKAKLQMQKRLSRRATIVAVFEAEDFDPDFERSDKASTNIAKLFQGVVGSEKIVIKLLSYQTIYANAKALGMNASEQLPFNFLFRGPPGTGKTSTAQKMGKIYYDMGFLTNAQVEERSAKDLVGEYVGQTGPKTEKFLESALGKVLFIDEAYRLAEGPYAKEAVDELVDCITKPKFFQKVIIILAGYDNDINQLMSINPGLSSRFPETIEFESLTSDSCLQLFAQNLQQKEFDSAAVSSPSVPFRDELLRCFDMLRAIDNFANARDVKTIAKAVRMQLLKSGKPSEGRMVVTEQSVIDEIRGMISERTNRAQHGKSSTIDGKELFAQAPQKDLRPPRPVTSFAPSKISLQTANEFEQHAEARCR